LVLFDGGNFERGMGELKSGVLFLREGEEIEGRVWLGI